MSAERVKMSASPRAPRVISNRPITVSSRAEPPVAGSSPPIVSAGRIGAGSVVVVAEGAAVVVVT